MKINEIIVESRGQLDEGMMDTIKSKLSGVYQMARKKYPNFDEVFAIAKSHKAEINDIIEQLKAKKETGKVSKEDVVAAIMPLSKKLAGEVGGGVVSEGLLDGKKTSMGAAVGWGVGIGAMWSPLMYGLGSLILAIVQNTNTQSVNFSFTEAFFTSIALFTAIMVLAVRSDNDDIKIRNDTEYKRKSNMSPQQLEREELQKEYDSLEYHYKNQHRDGYGKMSYAQTRRMEELYNQGFR